VSKSRDSSQEFTGSLYHSSVVKVHTSRQRQQNRSLSQDFGRSDRQAFCFITKQLLLLWSLTLRRQRYISKRHNRPKWSSFEVFSDLLLRARSFYVQSALAIIRSFTGLSREFHDQFLPFLFRPH